MTPRKSYRQFCGLARALDRVGDRWTLLIVRELSLGDQSFRDLAAALPGISPSLLTKRLDELADDGLVVRNDAPQRSKHVEYRLTDDGRSLQPAIIELIRWGSRWMVSGPGDDRVDARWAPLALRALLEGQPARRGRVHLDVDGVHVTIASSAGRRQVTAGRHGRADATVAAPLPVLLAVAADALALQDSGAAVSGDTAVAGALVAGGGGARA
ncbi:MAG: helix-turn-helix domain-containing protein [Egibacteraceae bacterium]